jgi:hypothetical protein
MHAVVNLTITDPDAAGRALKAVAGVPAGVVLEGIAVREVIAQA